MLLFVRLRLLLTLFVQIFMDKYEKADFRYSSCPYRDIIHCNNFMCVDCYDVQETYSIYLRQLSIRQSWQKQIDYEKNYLFSPEDAPCPF